MGVIVGIVFLIALYFWLKKIIAGSAKLFGGVLVLGAGVLCAPAVMVGYGAEWACRKLRLRLAVSILIILFLIILSIDVFENGADKIEAGGFQSGKYLITTILMVFSVYAHRKLHKTKLIAGDLEFLNEIDVKYFRLLIGISCLLFMSMLLEGFNIIFWFELSWFYWGTSTIVMIYAISEQLSAKSIIELVATDLSTKTKVDITGYVNRLDVGALDRSEAENIFFCMYHSHLKKKLILEIEVGGKTWAVNNNFYQENRTILEESSSRHIKNDLSRMVDVTASSFNFSREDAEDFVDRHIDFGRVYEFDDGDYFVNFICEPKVKTCCSCGVATEVDPEHDEPPGEWFCSDICFETEQRCHNVFKDENHIIDRAVDGAVAMSISNMYRQNHKVFAVGGQGHGFAAENANTYIDRAQGRYAKVIGDDNALNGADRLVNGIEIQTKYCKTAARSIGAAFDGKDGNYRYYDSQTKSPMQVEVPKDQYAAAVKEMEKKISEGKVDGIADPKEARSLVRCGSLTYEQARNITKFGTIESVSYDLAEGAVIGLAAGGIGFSISAFVFYSNTKDINASLRAAVVQAGKTATRSTSVYVVTQQLHRLSSVQKMLTVVDATALSPTTCSFLQKGFGVTNKGALSSAMRGTLVSSVVIIAMTTGPDLIKMIRGRISKAQFLKNIAVASTGVAGGVAGSIVGGVAGAPLGPAGMMVGRIIGGAIGGAVSATVTNKIAGKFMVEDREKMVRILQKQLEYLAFSFVMNEDEITQLQELMSKSISQDGLEEMHASGNYRAAANSIAKPIAIEIIKNRESITVNESVIDQACAEIAA